MKIEPVWPILGSNVAIFGSDFWSETCELLKYNSKHQYSHNRKSVWFFIFRIGLPLSRGFPWHKKKKVVDVYVVNPIHGLSIKAISISQLPSLNINLIWIPILNIPLFFCPLNTIIIIVCEYIVISYIFGIWKTSIAIEQKIVFAMNFLWETAFAIIAMFRFFINLLRLLVQAPRCSESSLHFAFCSLHFALCVVRWALCVEKVVNWNVIN